MAHAERCPCCYGKGTLPPDTKTTDASEKACHGCGGSGWVTVYDQQPFVYPIPYPVPQYVPVYPYPFFERKYEITYVSPPGTLTWN